MANQEFYKTYSLALAKNKELCAELLEMADKDQAARKEAVFIMENWQDPAAYPRIIKILINGFEIDETNTARMKEIVRQYGFPGKTLVGLMGTQAAWLLVQHADADPEFQAECLELMEKALEADDVLPPNVAYLTDRVRVHQGLPQVYGTQGGPNGQPASIENVAEVDKRRAAAGLEPLEKYTGQLAEMYPAISDFADYLAFMREVTRELPPKYARQMQQYLQTSLPDNKEE